MATRTTEPEGERYPNPKLEDEEAPDGYEDEEGSEDEEGEREDEEYYCYRIDRLAKQLDVAVMLRPWEVFIQPVETQASTINRDDFRSRFRSFLKGVTPNYQEATSEILDGLFRRAVQAEKEYVAWDKTVMAVKSQKFRTSIEYVREELHRFVSVRKMFIKRYSRNAPEWMSPWERLWIEAFDELEEEIEAQLRGTQRHLEDLTQFATLGRTDIGSHILLLCSPSIKALIAQTRLSRTPVVAVAAFAYASRLMPLKDDANDAKGRYMNKVKARLSRAAASKARLNVLGFHFQSGAIVSGASNTARKLEK